ncbi:MAG: ATP-binding protein [Ferruginibacter sp.]
MKITKESEAAILKAYHAYWNSYLQGDMETFASMLDDHCHIIGSTAFDVFNDKKSAVEFYTATAEQVSGKAEFRNRKIVLLPYDDNVMVQEQCDFYFLAGAEWHFYGHARLSTLFAKKETGWKIIHQHGSLPDSKAEEGEQIAAEEIAAENKQLRDAIRRRTVELEYKNRELEIEASLERVRAVAMSMMKAEDLLEICKIQFNELKQLGFGEIRNALIGIFNDEKIYFTDHDYSDFSGGTICKIPYNKNPIIDRSIKQMKSATDAFTEFIVEGSELEEWKAFRKHNGEYDDTRIRDANAIYYYFYSISQGNVGISTFKKISNDQINILKRFRNVFDLAYRRYVDITHAEAQAREAQIELALERVRARTMAMHQSSELADTSAVLFQQIKDLGFDTWSCGFCIWAKDNCVEAWMGADSGGLLPPMMIPYQKEPTHHKIYEASSRGDLAHHYIWEGEALENHYAYLRSVPSVKKAIEILEDSGLSLPSTQCYYVGFFKQGYLLLITKEPNEEMNDLSKRFAWVFEQTYTRFLDLQKAEAQAREAKIDAALERTRTQSMIMQHSKELDDTLRVFHEQVQLLGIHSAFSFLWLPDEDKNRHIFWAAWAENGSVGSTFSPDTQAGKNGSTVFKSKSTNYPLDRNEPATAQCLVDWKSDEPVYSYAVPPEGVENYFAVWKELIDGVEKLKPEHFRGGLYYVEAFMKYGCFGVMTESDLTEHEKKILGRFAIEFERAYTRFLDLQKAEAQSREAKIEAAMEKVRGRAMGMQKPSELVDVAQLLRTEMGLLGVEELETSSIYIHNKISGLTECWFAIQDVRGGNKELIADHMNMRLKDTWVGREMLQFYSSGQKQTSILMQGANRIEWINYCAEQSKLLQGYYGDIIPERTYHLIKFSNGYMGAASPGDISSESWDLLKRATNVFSLAYTRFGDLQLAEAQAREAQVEAALERVRSRTLAMQKSDELAETASVLFKQLIRLGIAPNRLYIGIINDESGDIEFWITDEDGSRVSTMFSGNAVKNVSVKKMYDGWATQKKSIIIDMQGKELSDYFLYLGEELHVPFKGGLSQKRRLQNIAYFSKGFIGIASPEDLPDETTFLLERFAGVFNLTFTRFNDLKLAEAHAAQAEQDLMKLQVEKNRAEDALTELQATQKQLVQSEKMASLGQLTAGIAHEIQNPLNFVNNFSEVSSELIDEMNDEIAKGHLDEAKLIANDIKQNLEKINHHGKRADAIVKGMLQHSRSSSAAKEPTDINALTDEYIRLCYHGLRAKDNAFNATIQTDFDNTIEKINIIPQDMGRVVLNVLTNAFYAVNERRKLQATGYQPTVSIRTHKTGQKILINVTDNGSGIPQKVLDKIFQPFFTTKPTGQGTGLGLSLSYDIIKAHGGEIKVETKEGEGTEFIIQVPLTK